MHSRGRAPGAPATLTLDEFPGRTFHGTLVRTANAIDPASRTLLVEVDVDNPTGELLPGAYALVHLHLPEETRRVTVPANALLFRAEGLQVAVVQDGRAELVPVTIGRDYGTTVEIVSGLSPDRPGHRRSVDSLAERHPGAHRRRRRPRAAAMRRAAPVRSASPRCLGRRLHGGTRLRQAAGAHAPSLKESGRLEGRAAQATPCRAVGGGRSSAIPSSTRSRSRSTRPTRT